MHTVIETPSFQKQADKIWSEEERLDFVDWIVANPLAGDVIPGADGVRKTRGAASGKGKRGGVRVIYFNRSEEGIIYLIAIYRKSEKQTMTAKDIKQVL